MNRRKKVLKTLALGALAIGFAMLLAGWRMGRVPSASAQEPPPLERQRGIATLFGMQTLAPRQTAQITVVNPSEIIPCVRVRLVFDIYKENAPERGPAGENDPLDPVRLHFVRRVSREVELEPGEAASFDYTANGRGEFVSPASFAREDNEVSDPHRPRGAGESDLSVAVRTRATLATSTLVINERGRAISTVPGVRVSYDPQPNPPPH